MIAATGGVGKLVVAEALSQGYNVVAFARNVGKIEAIADAQGTLTKVAFDTTEDDAPTILEQNIEGCKAVLVCVGGGVVVESTVRMAMDACVASQVPVLVRATSY